MRRSVLTALIETGTDAQSKPASGRLQAVATPRHKPTTPGRNRSQSYHSHRQISPPHPSLWRCPQSLRNTPPPHPRRPNAPGIMRAQKPTVGTLSRCQPGLPPRRQASARPASPGQPKSISGRTSNHTPINPTFGRRLSWQDVSHRYRHSTLPHPAPAVNIPNELNSRPASPPQLW